jgi:hypothetical protein
MNDVNDKNVKTGQQGTNQPWTTPAQSDHHRDEKSPSPPPRQNNDNKTA